MLMSWGSMASPVLKMQVASQGIQPSLHPQEVIDLHWSPLYFQPVAIETTGVYGKSTAPFLSGHSKKLVDVSGDPRECQWLHQRLSLAVARGNAVSILACVQVWSDFTCSCSSCF